MGKQALRWLLGAGYVVLVTLLLLYQMGVIGKTRDSFITVLGTLLLGIALAVVLVLYMRVTDQMKIQDREALAAQGKDAQPENLTEPEDIYAAFLNVTQGCQLSERELEVAWLLYRGYTNRQIGEELYIAETTVKKHVSHIYQKMEVGSRKEFRAKVQAGE